MIPVVAFMGPYGRAQCLPFRAAQFLDTWDALDPSERQARGTADAVRKHVGLKLLDLLGIVADVACRIAMYQAQMLTALSHPFVVGKTIDRALTDEGVADRIALHKATGFLPMPKGSQTTITIMQNAQANATAQASSVSAPSPENTIRRLTDRFNEAHRLPRTAAPALPERTASGTSLRKIPEGEEGDGK